MAAVGWLFQYRNNDILVSERATVLSPPLKPQPPHDPAAKGLVPSKQGTWDPAAALFKLAKPVPTPKEA